MTYTFSSRSARLAIVMISLVATGCGFEQSSALVGPMPPTASAQSIPIANEVRTVDFAAFMATPAADRHEEFGGAHLSFRAYVSQMIGIGTCPVSVAPGEGWLNPCGGLSRVLVAAPGRDEGLAAFVPPGLNLDEIPVDHWVEVIGHFNDPAAARCGVQGEDGPMGDDEAVELCRAVFVLDRVSVER